MNRPRLTAVLLLLLLVVSVASVTTATHTLSTIADHEDGDLSEWDSTECGWSASQTQAAAGTSWSARHSGDAACGTDNWMDVSFTASDYEELSFYIYPDTTSQDNRPPEFRYSNGGRSTSNYVFNLDFSNGNVIVVTSTGNTDTGIDITGEAWNKIIATNIDYASETFDLVVEDTNGNTIGEATGLDFFRDPQSQGGNFHVSNSDSTDVVFVDEFEIAETSDAHMHGTVTNSTGSGVEDATVTLRTEDEPGLITAETTTDSNGDWSIDDSELTTNTYTVFVNKWPAYYTNRTVVEYTSGTETDAGTIELESRGPRITLADPRANEYIRDRSVNGFNYSYTIQQPISEDNNDDFNTIVYWKNDSTGEFENIHSESNTVKSGTYTVDFQNPDAGNPGINQWFVSVELDRGTFNSTTYQYNTPGNITLVDASTDATITDATIEAEITALNSDFQTTLSTSDGKLDLNDIPREDHKATFTTTSGTTYLDRTLIIDETDITKLWTVALVNETEFDNEAEWYQQSFELDDQTGQWDPSDVYLFLEQRVSGSYQIITGGQFGFQNNVTLAVNDTESYRMTLLHAERGDTRQVGDFTADRDNAGQIQTITIDSTSPPPEEDSEGYTVNATITNTTGSEPIFRFQFNDSESETFDISFTVHEKGNESNVLQNMSNVSFDSAGSITFTIPVTQAEAGETWHVDWSATRDGTDISGTLTVGGAALDPGVDMPDTWKHWGATIFIILIGGLFGGSVNARLGVVVTPMIAGVFWVAEWLPTNYTIGIIIFALILGGMLLVANHQLGN